MFSAKGLANLIAVIIHAVGFAVYLYMLYYSHYIDVYIKGCMYLGMALMHLYLVIDEWGGLTSYKQLQFNTINKCIFIVNFGLIAGTIFNLCDGVYYMFIYLFLVALTSIFIMHSGLQNEYFKDGN
jgi:hypothetical protein